MNEEEDFKKKFEEANPGIKLTERTKKKTIESTKRLKISLSIMGLLIFMGIMSGAPFYAYVFVPIVGLIAYYGYRPELDEE